MKALPTHPALRDLLQRIADLDAKLERDTRPFVDAHATQVKPLLAERRSVEARALEVVDTCTRFCKAARRDYSSLGEVTFHGDTVRVETWQFDCDVKGVDISFPVRWLYMRREKYIAELEVALDAKRAKRERARQVAALQERVKDIADEGLRAEVLARLDGLFTK